MLIDHLNNHALYHGLPPRLVKALDFLRTADLAKLPLGRFDIDGDRLFALVQEYASKLPAECRWEAHRKYHDVQFVAAGLERIGWLNLLGTKVVVPYDPEKDAIFLEPSGPMRGDLVTVAAGMFMLLSPQDAHMPCVAAGAPQPVRKIVVKVAVAD